MMNVFKPGLRAVSFCFAMGFLLGVWSCSTPRTQLEPSRPTSSPRPEKNKNWHESQINRPE
jgi:hypothetical protein